MPSEVFRELLLPANLGRVLQQSLFTTVKLRNLGSNSTNIVSAKRVCCERKSLAVSTSWFSQVV